MATIKEIMIEQEKIEMKVCTKEGLDGVSFDGEYITLEGHYEIAISRVSTKDALCGWIVHLLSKKWTTAHHLGWLVKISSKYHGYNPHTDI